MFRTQHDVSNLGLTLICLQAASQIAKASSKVDLQVRLKPHGGAVALQLTLMQLEETNTQKTDLLKVMTPVVAVTAGRHKRKRSLSMSGIKPDRVRGMPLILRSSCLEYKGEPVVGLNE